MERVGFKHREVLVERLKNFLSHSWFGDVCLSSRVFSEPRPVRRIYHAPATDDVTYDEAVHLEYRPVQIGMDFGPLWSKHWFRLDIEIPASWEGQEVVLKWLSDTECQVWSDGLPVQGLSCMKKRFFYTITPQVAKTNLKHRLYIESSVNGLYTDHNAAGDDFRARLSVAEIRTKDRDVEALRLDLQILYELVTSLPKESSRTDDILMVANDVINACALGDRSSYTRARALASRILSQRNGCGGHVIHAVGYANIDTAWLWPYRKTPMKSVSSWSSIFRLMDQYPFKLAFTQPQQLLWVKKRYPDFYSRVCSYIQQGHFIPTGATWVEMDSNLPSGECLIRQFLYGQRFLQKEYGIRCTDLWILDSFGYSAQLPQIMLHCDVTRFVSIKLSWNSVNHFPHSTFWWQGVGGHRVLAHFPPGNNYHKEVAVREVQEVEKVFSDGGRSDSSLYLFGHGNAGLGPTEEMLEKLERLKDLKGLPRVKLSSPEEFYESVERDTSRLCTWVGELYLERHQGTYTSQAQVKYRNRRAEFLMRDMDLLSAVASVMSSISTAVYSQPRSEIERIWKLLLVCQFHDVLPGTAHPEAYKDFHADIDDLEQSAKSIYKQSLNCILASHLCHVLPVERKMPKSLNGHCNVTNGTSSPRSQVKNKANSRQKIHSNGSVQAADPTTEANGTGGISENRCVVVNTLSWSRREVMEVTHTATGSRNHSQEGKRQLALLEAPSCGFSVYRPCEVLHPVSASAQDGVIHLSNHLFSVCIDRCGRVSHMQKTGDRRNFLKGEAGNQMLLYDDFPLYRDAWDSMDYTLQTGKCLEDVTEPATLVESSPHRAVVKVCLRINPKSQVTQFISMDTECPYIRFKTKVKWQESHKFLKVEFPTSITSPNASYEIQFGHLQRPTHYNTSWDSAKYEVCGHKWACLSEHGGGVALLTDSKYGYSCVEGTLRLSLLRAPKAPDPKTDMGEHEFTYAIMPFTGSLQEAGVIQQAYQLNSPLRPHILQPSCHLPVDTSFFWLDSHQVILETVKMAEDDNGAMVLRLYEAFGGSTSCTLSSSLPFRKVYRCNGLEERLDEQVDYFPGEPGTIQLQMSSFQIQSLLLHF